MHARYGMFGDFMIMLARMFAKFAHRKQKRKYTGEPYFVHCQEVAEIVRTVPHTWQMVCAAYLHDTVEDTWVKLWMVRMIFGKWVAYLVECLTDVSNSSDGNRAARKAIDRTHTATAHPDAKTIKLADLLSNTRSIVSHDAKFAKVYLAEKKLLLGVLGSGNKILHGKASAIVNFYTKTPE